MVALITVEDLVPFADIPLARAEAMIADAEAMALAAAPCLADATDVNVLAAARGILRRAILRWDEAGNAGARKAATQTAGPFTRTDTYETPSSRGLFWPSELTDLQRLCEKPGARAGAWSLDMGGQSSAQNPLSGAVINSNLGTEPIGQWSPFAPAVVPFRLAAPGVVV